MSRLGSRDGERFVMTKTVTWDRDEVNRHGKITSSQAIDSRTTNDLVYGGTCRDA